MAGTFMAFIIRFFPRAACDSIAPCCLERQFGAVVEPGGHTTTSRQVRHSNPKILWSTTNYPLTSFPQPPILRIQTRQHKRDLVACCSADGLLAIAIPGSTE